MPNPKISINLVVLNGEKYVRRCLESVQHQSYPRDEVEVHVFDNGSTDKTLEIVEEFSNVRLIKSSHNFGPWGGWEELLKYSIGEYVIFLSVDVILQKDFVAQAVQAMEARPKLGGLQSKTYQYSHTDSFDSEPVRQTIDTCGFKISRSRKVVNIGHGQSDSGQFDKPADIFGVEGAVPVFRKTALESIRVLGEITDHDLFWYAEDLDVAWRLRMAGWEQRYEPSIVAWHDRQTTKKTRRGIIDFIATRDKIPLNKRRLEWRNIRWTIIKNDYIINILKDLPYIITREVAMTTYLLIFETAVFAELPKFFKLLPKMLRKRREIIKQAKINPRQIHAYFI